MLVARKNLVAKAIRTCLAYASQNLVAKAIRTCLVSNKKLQTETRLAFQSVLSYYRIKRGEAKWKFGIYMMKTAR